MPTRFAVLVQWNDAHHPPNYMEVLVGRRQDPGGQWVDAGFTMAEAELVARQARRLGAVMASVLNVRQAYRLAERQLSRQQQQDQESLADQPIPPDTPQ